MMAEKQYETHVVIDASQDVVWKKMSDVESWPQWTPTMISVRHISGNHVGALYEVKQPGLPKSKLEIEAWNEGASFVWASRESGPTMVANHVLTQIEPNKTEVTLTVTMTGFMTSVVWLLWGRKIRSFVETEAARLKLAGEKK